MRLKALIVSLVALGISAPLLAAGLYDVEISSQQDVMRDQMNNIDMFLDQNQPGGFDQPCGWTCRINVSGWINADAYIANRPPVFLNLSPLATVPALVANGNRLLPTAGRASDLLLNNTNLFIDARVNNWVTANTSLVYSSVTAIPGSQGFYGIANSLLIYHPVPSGNGVTRNIDTAYATIGNFQASPIYFRVGKEYLPFGQYEPYAFIQSENPTQLITEINATTAQLGFIARNGFYGSVYTFAGKPQLNDGGSTRRIQNGGADLGYVFATGDGRINIDAGYIANIADSNFLSSYYTNSLIEGTSVPGLPNKKTSAYDVNADVQYGPFDANAHFVAATSDLMSPLMLGFPNPAPLLPFPASLGKPNAWGVEAGYTFPMMSHESRLAIGYQQTNHLATLLPKKRIYADYMVNLSKWLDMGIALFQDRDYSFQEGIIALTNLPDGTPVIPPVFIVGGATGNKSTVGQLRASIKFA
ncbi:MAG: LbtU family siderophore porin [Pseudomonadota bacterium]